MTLRLAGERDARSGQAPAVFLDRDGTIIEGVGYLRHVDQIAMLPWSIDMRGRFEEHRFDSAALRGNPLGDPSQRPLWVYLPPGYDDAPARRYPTIYQIHQPSSAPDRMQC